MSNAAASLGLALIGAGVVGAMRATTIAGNPRTRLIAVADVDAARAKTVADRAGATAVTDHRQALEVPGVDAVIVSTPGFLHETAVMDALSAGKHVLCEKPLGIDGESCRRMIEAAAAARRMLAVGFNHRYYPCIKELKAAIGAEKLGTIDHVRAMAGHPGLGEFRAEWAYQRKKSGGGAMMDVGIHMTDLVRHVAGEIASVNGVCTNRVWSVDGSEDNAIAVMKTVTGIPVRYQASWSEWKGYRLALEVYGSRGMAGAYYAPMINVTVTTDEGRLRRSRKINLHPWINVREKLRGWQTTATLAFAEEFADFLNMIDGRPTAIADGLSGLRAVEIARAVESSSVSGETVHIPV